MIPLNFALPIFVQAASLFLGIFVFFSNPREKTNRVFGFLVLFSVFWIFCVFLADLLKEYEVVMFWTKMAIVGPTMIGSLFYYFSLIFPRERKTISTLRQFLIFVPTIIILLLSPTSQNVKEIKIEQWGTSFVPGLLYYLMFFYLLLYFGIALRNLWQSRTKTDILIEKHQIKFIFIALLGALVVGLFANLVFPILGRSEVSKYGPSFSVIFFVVVASIAILRHHLLDTRVILTEALVFFLISILVVRIPVSRGFEEMIFEVVILILTSIIGGILIRGVLKEIDYRKELEEAYAELKKLDMAKTEFISIASHQLRTPLTIIKGYVSMMLEGTYGRVAKKAQKPLENVLNSNERLIRLVNDLLMVSKVETGKIEVEFSKANLEEIIVDLLKELEPKAREKKIYLKLEKSKELLPIIMIDKDKIRQTIFNILDNGIRYTNQGGLTVALRKLDSKVRITIRDTGEGMNQEEAKRLFSSFSRGSAGVKLWAEGAGLGLYIAKKFIDFHHGRIWAKSPGKGKGSIFFIELPIYQSEK